MALGWQIWLFIVSFAVIGITIIFKFKKATDDNIAVLLLSLLLPFIAYYYFQKIKTDKKNVYKDLLWPPVNTKKTDQYWKPTQTPSS